MKNKKIILRSGFILLVTAKWVPEAFGRITNFLVSLSYQSVYKWNAVFDNFIKNATFTNQNKNKNKIMKLLKLLPIILLFSCTGKVSKDDKVNEAINKVEYSNYLNKQFEFSLNYPSAWDTTKRDNRITFMAVEFNKQDTTDSFNESMNISVFPNEGLTLEELVNENIKLAKQYYVNATITTKEDINENGLKYYQLTLKMNRQGINLINYSTFFDNGKYLFTLTQTTEQEKSEKYKPIFTDVINSFNWSNE